MLQRAAPRDIYKAEIIKPAAHRATKIHDPNSAFHDIRVRTTYDT